jgi:hypothetical protein
MTDYIKHINNVETGEITVEPLTDLEVKARDKEIADAEKAKKAKEAELLANAQAKTALLERLGITEDEAKLLIN